MVNDGVEGTHLFGQRDRGGHMIHGGAVPQQALFAPAADTSTLVSASRYAQRIVDRALRDYARTRPVPMTSVMMNRIGLSSSPVFDP